MSPQRYTQAFVKRVIAEVKSGKSIAAVAREFEITRVQIEAWMRAAQGSNGSLGRDDGDSDWQLGARPRKKPIRKAGARKKAVTPRKATTRKKAARKATRRKAAKRK